MQGSSSKLRAHAHRVLCDGARSAAPHVVYDRQGYAPRWEDNVIPGLPLPAIASDFEAGAGRELGRKPCAAHSSAALVLNTFGPYRAEPGRLRLAGVNGFLRVRFEAKLPTGLGGTPPHLDVLADGAAIVAVESKCTEWMRLKAAEFADSYDRLSGLDGAAPWLEVMRKLRTAPGTYSFLDAAQLIKHTFGLLKRYGRQPVQIVYLYWEPRGAASWMECAAHRAEADDLAAATRSSNVRLVPMSYHELWDDWGKHAPPPHLAYLLRRYAAA